MLIELPQADSCCGASLRSGVIIIIALRVVLLVLIILVATGVINLDQNNNRGRVDENCPKACKKLFDLHTAEIILLTVTVVLLVLWILIMVPAVIWEVLSLILTGALFEIIIWIWVFFIMAFQFAINLIRETLSFYFIASIVCLGAECFIVWILWSYYVEVKAILIADRQVRTSMTSTE